MLAGAVAGYGITFAVFHVADKRKQIAFDVATAVAAIAVAWLPSLAARYGIRERHILLAVAAALPLIVVIAVFQQWPDVRAELRHEGIPRLPQRRRRPHHRPSPAPPRPRRLGRPPRASRVRPPRQPHRPAQAPAAQPHRRRGAPLPARDHQTAHADPGNEPHRPRRAQRGRRRGRVVGYNDARRMRVDPAPFLRTAAALLLATAPSLLFAQAGRTWDRPGSTTTSPSRSSKSTPGIKKTRRRSASVRRAGGNRRVVRDEYAILEDDVVIEYQDINIHADKVTLNLKTKDVVAEGHVILDQGPTRITGDHIVFNLDTKTGTFFNATGALQPDMYFTGDKIEKARRGPLPADERHVHLVRSRQAVVVVPRRRAPTSRSTTTRTCATSRFRAHDVPLFCTPRLVWPTKSDRSQRIPHPARPLLADVRRPAGDRLLRSVRRLRRHHVLRRPQRQGLQRRRHQRPLPPLAEREASAT